MASNLRRYANSVAPLKTSTALLLESKAMNTFPAKDGAPWNDFAKIYSLRIGLNEPIIVAQRTGGASYDVVFIHCCNSLSESQIELVQRVQHENFTTVHDIYREYGTWHIVTEQAVLSLQEAVGNPFLDSSMIAAITGQIVTALVYLESQGVRCKSLTCSDVLLHATGRVTLDRQWDCVYSDTKDDIRRLGCVMMELMDGYVKEGGSIGLDDPARWSPEALQFLGATTSASSAKQLLKHPFLASWQRAKLQGVISLTMTWTTQRHQYIGPKSRRGVVRPSLN